MERRISPHPKSYRITIIRFSVKAALYLWEAPSVRYFVQRLAVSLLGHGYYFYVTGEVPERKEPRAIDEKLVSKYGINISRASRSRRKAAGFANIHYLRYDRFFVLVATHGRHAFFEEEASRIRDAREKPLRFAGYSISHRGGHPHVRIDQEVYLDLKAHFLEMAVHRSTESLEATFRARLHYEPYAPVRAQTLSIWRAVNAKRRTAGYEPISRSCAWFSRKGELPFPASLERIPAN